MQKKTWRTGAYPVTIKKTSADGEKGLSAKEEDVIYCRRTENEKSEGHAASIIALALAAGAAVGTGRRIQPSAARSRWTLLDVSELKGQYVEAEVYLIVTGMLYRAHQYIHKPLYCHREGNTLFR